MKLAATVIAVVLALTAQAAAKSTQPALLAVVWASGGPLEIVQLDPLSLKSVSRRARVSEPAWFIARSPARDRAAFMIGRNQDRLHFLDVRRMRIIGGIRVSGVSAGRSGATHTGSSWWPTASARLSWSSTPSPGASSSLERWRAGSQLLRGAARGSSHSSPRGTA